MRPLSSSSELVERIEDCLAAIRSHTTIEPRVGIVLGTGLGALVDRVDVVSAIPYVSLPGFAESTVESHSGRLVFGNLGATPVVVMQGRLHAYEGYSLQQVTFPVRVMRGLGVETLIVSNVSGGMNPLWRAGELVLLSDHINLLGDNPLVGPNVDALGPRFPDMSEPYSRDLQEIAIDAALSLEIRLHRGVYAAVTGPMLETRAEYRMLRRLGADVVGMSTVPEVIVARHMGMRVLGLSIISDECFPDALEPVDVSTIIATATSAEPNLTRLIERVVDRICMPSK